MVVVVPNLREILIAVYGVGVMVVFLDALITEVRFQLVGALHYVNCEDFSSHIYNYFV